MIGKGLIIILVIKERVGGSMRPEIKKLQGHRLVFKMHKKYNIKKLAILYVNISGTMFMLSNDKILWRRYMALRRRINKILHRENLLYSWEE